MLGRQDHRGELPAGSPMCHHRLKGTNQCSLPIS
nr:MAG TPA: hypothetical protein [Caudoviricetes sp.]DAS82746.1 MAG TPA: hypothetical protein [Caudoviricetes sp.]